MAKDQIRYDLLVQEALKGVVRKILSDAGRDGLHGEHHFYISFRTDYPGVRLSNRLREKYPQEMTIVLQHQFWDLGVTEHAFEVGLSFSGVPERLLIPFDALTGFFDPSVQFGLKFEVQEEEQVETPPASAPEPSRPARGAGSEPVELQPKKTPAPVGGRSPTPRLPPKPPSQAGKTTDGDEGQPAEERKGEAGAEVVSLDAFRKKN
ncbi:SspB family protein [Microvirga massiliensis]|uniref:SspB family protein n=1 Tax=Microvirga massiliensis TaxID=1033741 RepID=UPI00062B5FC3|nr:ClpXP protease specificity-enhancing factor SspB [Microvirga massiliensis]